MPTDDKPHGFWSSFAGVLGALAALIAAISGLVVAIRPSLISAPPPAASAPIASAPLTSAPPPAASSTIVSQPDRPKAPEQPPTTDYHRLLPAITGTGDWVRVVSVSPPPTTLLKAGEDTLITFRVRYFLKSAQSARLLVAIARSDSGCSAHMTAYGAGSVPITGGSGEAEVQARWNGGRTPDGAPSEGYIAPYFMIDHRDTESRVVPFPILVEACYRFSG